MISKVSSENDVSAFFTLADHYAEEEIPLLISMLETAHANWKSLAIDAVLRKLGVEDTTKLTIDEANVKVVLKNELFPTLVKNKFIKIIQELEKKLK